MRAAWALIVLVAACADRTICERTGQCLSVGDGSVEISAVPPLEPAQMFRPPVDSALAISSTFGPRYKVSASRDDFHLGIDYYGELGTDLFAIGAGVVVGVYPDGGDLFPNGGNVVVIEHAIEARTFHDQTVDHFYAVYLHCDSIVVALGDNVTGGQRVATMGMTGDTDFVHLHFETRVQTMCSLPYQIGHPDSSCALGFDPHVHPYLFVGGANEDSIRVEEIPADSGYAVRYIATRGDLDLDAIETDFGVIDFDTREGIDATSITTLDNFDYGFMTLVPVEFVSASDLLEYEFRFTKRPAYLELRDIYGDGLRFGNVVH
jgi:hypothetical protein